MFYLQCPPKSCKWGEGNAEYYSLLPAPPTQACAGVCCIFQWSDMVMGKAESWGPGDVTCLNITRCQPHQTQIWQSDIVTSHFRSDRPGSRKIVSIYGIKDSIFLIIIPHCPEAQKWFVLKQSLNLLYHYHHLQHQDILVVQYETNRTKHVGTKLLIVNVNRKMSDADDSKPN